MCAFCAGSYILGIGDRHLENFLLDQCDGTVVGIDFGLAFGSGLGLPAPELIPFRLTQQVCLYCTWNDDQTSTRNILLSVYDLVGIVANNINNMTLLIYSLWVYTALVASG